MRLEHDPIQIHARRVDETERVSIEAEVDEEIKTAFEKAYADPFPG